MTHSDSCKSANRFGDGFDCICGYYERPQPAQPEIECVMCSTKFNAPVACRDCTEYAQDSVGVPKTPKGVGAMKPIQRHELESYRYGGFDMYSREFGDWLRVDDIYSELVRLYRRTGSQEVYEVIHAIKEDSWEFWCIIEQYEEEP